MSLFLTFLVTFLPIPFCLPPFVTLPALQKNFVNIFFVFAWEFCIEKRRGFLVNFFWSPFPTKRSTKSLEKFGENSEQNSGQNSGRKFEKFGKLSFCSFSDLTFCGRMTIVWPMPLQSELMLMRPGKVPIVVVAVLSLPLPRQGFCLHRGSPFFYRVFLNPWFSQSPDLPLPHGLAPSKTMV